VDPAKVERGHQSRVQGGFGEVWIDVLAAAAGLNCYHPPRLDLGFDRMIEDRDGEAARLQVKTTSDLLDVAKGGLRYDLDVDAYDRLRKPMTIPSYLVVVQTRAAQREWVASMEWGTILRRSAHYVSLQGAGPTTNASKIRVSVPLGNMVTPRALHDMVEGGA